MVVDPYCQFPFAHGRPNVVARAGWLLGERYMSRTRSVGLPRSRKAVRVPDPALAIAAPEATSRYPCERSFAGTPLGAFVRDSYAEACFRFLAELKQRVRGDGAG